MASDPVPVADPSLSAPLEAPSTSGVTLTPLSGPFPSPLSFQLTLDNSLILLDCGVFDSPPSPSPSSSSPLSRKDYNTAVTSYLNRLRSIAPKANLLLLSSPTLECVGLLPWLREKCGLRCPVYATLPTREMGRWSVEDWVLGRSEGERNKGWEEEKVRRRGGTQGDVTTTTTRKSIRKGKGKMIKEEETDVKMEMETDHDHLPLPDEEDDSLDPWTEVWSLPPSLILSSFLSILSLRHLQPIHLSSSLKGTTLLSISSGHSLGGSIFSLRPSLSSSLSPASSANSFLYAPRWNHIKERLLGASGLLEGGRVGEGWRRTGTVVVGGGRSRTKVPKRADRERAFLETITNHLLPSSSATSSSSSSRNVLIPTDPSSRIFELLILLESHWTFRELTKENCLLILISKTGREVIGFLRSLTEWMGDEEGRGGERVLKFLNLRIFPSIEVMENTLSPTTSKCILITPTSLSYGPSRNLFVKLAQSKENLVLLTNEGREGSLGKWLVELWNERQEEGRKWGEGEVGRMTVLGDGKEEEGVEMELEMKKKVYLEGEELEEYERKIKEEAEAEEKRQAMLERSRRMMAAQEEAESDFDSEGEGEEEEVEEVEEVTGTIVKRRRVGGYTGGAGAWDEFLDPSLLQTQSSAPSRGGGGGGGNFDIYVRGSFGVRNEGLGGLERFRMFPVIERKRRVDAYGEAIDVEGWLKRGREDEEGEEEKKRLQGLGMDGKVVKRQREEEVVEEEEKPHKYVVELIKIMIKCQVFVVDMDGRSDGRALKTIIPQINPRKLVIVDGSPEALEDLANACKEVSSMTKEIYVPKVGETIKVGEETKNFSVRLGDSVMASLRLNRVDDYDVAFVSGVISVDPESDIPVLERTALTNAMLEAPEVAKVEEIDPTTVAVKEKNDEEEMPLSTISNVLPSLKPSLFIGDLKLTILKDRLRLLNVPSEFAGEGILVCGPAPPESFAFVSSATNVDHRKGARAIAASVSAEAMEVSGGKVAVRKMGRGRLVIEGSPGETFYVVRRIVYSLHASAS